MIHVATEGRLPDRWPDRWDVIGASLCLAGAAAILLGPRSA